jgi:hypothetical protein
MKDAAVLARVLAEARVAPRRAVCSTSSAAADAPPQAASALAMCRAPFRSADEVNADVIAVRIWSLVA